MFVVLQNSSYKHSQVDSDKPENVVKFYEKEGLEVYVTS